MSGTEDDLTPHDEYVRPYMEDFYELRPRTRSKPCAECPWLRTSIPGHLGPNSPEEWCEIAHSEAPVPCHMTMNGDGWNHGTQQCKGLAIFRGNVMKTPRSALIERAERDTKTVFSWDDEFIAHHGEEGWK